VSVIFFEMSVLRIYNSWHHTSASVGPRARTALNVKANSTRSRPGFTLIELLVTIGVAMVLSSLMIGAASRAREETRRVICMSNLRQLGIAIQSYAAGNNGYYPVEELCGNPQRHLVNGLVPTHVPDMGVFYCPSARDLEPYAQSDEYGGPGGDSIIDTPVNRQRCYVTYKYFSITQRDTRMPLPLRLSQYPHILRDSSPPQRWLASDYVRKNIPVFPHRQKGGWGGGRNVMFADISVRFIRHKASQAFGDTQ